MESTGLELTRVEDVRRREAIMAQMAAELREQAGIDPLTGLDTRTRFELRLGQELKRAARNGHPTAVAVLDIVGSGGPGSALPSLVLIEAANELREVLRDIDTVARIGPTRFAALLPTCDARSAIIAVERVVSRLSRLSSVEVVAGMSSTTQVAGWELMEAAEMTIDAAAGRLAEAV